MAQSKSGGQKSQHVENTIVDGFKYSYFNILEGYILAIEGNTLSSATLSLAIRFFLSIEGPPSNWFKNIEISLADWTTSNIY